MEEEKKARHEQNTFMLFWYFLFILVIIDEIVRKLYVVLSVNTTGWLYKTLLVSLNRCCIEVAREGGNSLVVRALRTFGHVSTIRLIYRRIVIAFCISVAHTDARYKIQRKRNEKMMT